MYIKTHKINLNISIGTYLFKRMPIKSVAGFAVNYSCIVLGMSLLSKLYKANIKLECIKKKRQVYYFINGSLATVVYSSSFYRNKPIELESPCIICRAIVRTDHDDDDASEI